MLRKTFKLAKAHMTEEGNIKRRKLDIQERELRLREYEMGLITKEEYRQQMEPVKENTPDLDLPSSDWDYEKLAQDLEENGA